MNISYKIIELKKRYPLAISRGVTTGSRNLFVEIEDHGRIGIGECAPGTGFDETLADIAQKQLESFVADNDLEQYSVRQIYTLAREQGVNPSAIAAFDMALWDLLAKKCVMPLYRVFGLGARGVPTSVTIGINPPEITRERVPEILQRTGAKSLKIKLGSPDGLDADKQHYLAALESSRPFHVACRVDANGGWNVAQSKEMMAWLAQHGCEYVEQPLAKGEEAGLIELFENRPLPIFVDESCHFSTDVPGLVGKADGVNLKLMKCGGLTEALRIVATARACGLKTMIGCMGETSVAISAGASLGELFDYIDLDSQLNLDPDPCTGANLTDGVVVPPEIPGHGAWYAPEAPGNDAR